MKTIKPVIFCSLIVGALSMAQTDVYAHGEARGGHGAPPPPAEGVTKPGNVDSHGAGDTAPKAPEAGDTAAKGQYPYKGIDKGPDASKSAPNSPPAKDGPGLDSFTGMTGVNRPNSSPQGPEAIKVD